MENSNSNDQLAEYKEKLCAEAENLLANIIPDKVKEIQVWKDSIVEQLNYVFL